MTNETKTKTKKLAVSSMLSALSVVILYIGSVINVLDLTAVAVVSLIMLFAVAEIGSPYHWGIYAVVSILSFLILPDKFASIAFIFLGGIYPILKPKLDSLSKVSGWLLKLLFFNAVLTALLAVSLFILHIEDGDLGFNVITYILGNATFVLYDFSVGVISNAYMKFLRKWFNADKLFGKK